MKDSEKVIVLMAEEAKEFVVDVDGYVYWCPAELGGHLSAYQLRVLADELDRRNESWNKIVQAEVGETR